MTRGINLKYVTAIGAVSVLLTMSACSSQPPAEQSQSTEDPVMDSPAIVISKVTGPGSLDQTDQAWDIHGTDLGIMWPSASGDMMVVFGDTFGEGWAPPGGNGSNWRSQVITRSSDRELADGMTLDRAVLDEEGRAKELIPSFKIDNVEMTTIPTSGTTVLGRQYMGFMSVRHWGIPGEWLTNYASIAYSDDDGETWSVDGSPVWDNDEGAGSDNFQMVAFVESEGYLYVFGTRSGRSGAAQLARVPSGSILDKEAYTYWDGNGWSADQQKAQAVVDAPVSELSVQWNEHSKRWLMMYLQGPDIILRHSTDLTGEWSSPQLVASASDYPGLYGGFIHPWSSGQDVYFAMSQWDPYNVYLMRLQIDTEGQIVNPNLILDPSFERQFSGSATEPWECQGECLLEDSMWGFMGDKNLLLTGGGQPSIVSQPVLVSPEGEYTLRVWTQGDEGISRGVIGVKNKSGKVLDSMEFDLTKPWSEQSLTFNVKKNSEITIYIEAPDQGASIQIDDVSLVRS